MKTITLIIDCENSFCSIQVYDHSMKMVGNGVGYLELSLLPGIYKFSVSASGSNYSKLVQLVENQPEKRIFIGEELRLTDSIIPVRDSPVADQATILSRNVNYINDGDQHDKSRFFLFVQADEYNDYYRLNRIELINQNGTLVYDFHNVFACDPHSFPNTWSNGETIQVDPGFYFLRFHVNGKQFDQALFLSKGQLTQLFMRIGDHSWLELESMVFAQSKGYLAFDAGSREHAYNSCPQAVDMLNDNLNIPLDVKAARNMAYRKFDNPFLGIYSAHLLVRHYHSSKYHQFIYTIFRNSLSILGEHPDIMIIGFWLLKNYPEFNVNDLNREYQFEHPPMLKHSWTLLNKLSNEYDLIPEDSPTAYIGTHIIDNGTWLTWEKIDDLESFKSETAYSLQDEDILPRLYAQLIDESFHQKENRITANPLEKKILNHLERKLPTQFLQKLTLLINNEYSAYSEDKKADLEEEIVSLMRFMSPDILELLKKTTPYLSSNVKDKIEAILASLSDNRFDYLSNKFPEVKLMNSDSFETPEFIQKEQRSFLKKSFSKSLAKHLKSSEKSIDIALKGLKNKMKL
ncbi:MAG: hypothetical protein KDD41_08700 [Flavobacteriales bacterium]|nr:hypothetical protein [Flavobacteriales bacterium]